MPRQRSGQTAAGFIREQGWHAPIVLRGSPIVRNGEELEPGVVLSVTAVGSDAVLGIATEGMRLRETIWGFGSRDWSVVVSPTDESEGEQL